jgi:hypothetical protein
MTALQTPVEIDTKISELRFQLAKAQSLIERYERLEDDWYRSRLKTDYDNAVEREIALYAEIGPLEAEYRSRPWVRYYHVNNVNGHIHNSLHCSSCFPDTQYAWRTDLSGLSEEEVVKREAYNACSVCMPIAPAEQRAARERYNQAQRDAKAAERQAKKDAKADKARQRAVKLVDKVEKEIEKLGGIDVLRNDYSLYGRNVSDGQIGRRTKSLYDATFDMQQTVGDVLYEMKQRQEEGRSHHDMNEHVKAELEKRGLI